MQWSFLKLSNLLLLYKEKKLTGQEYKTLQETTTEQAGQVKRAENVQKDLDG